MPTLIEDLSFDVAHFNYERTVQRSLVHKQSLDNVLLTEITSRGEDRFVCAARIPTAHQFFNDAGRWPTKDILFYAEVGRQASIAISHAFLGVAGDEVFIFEGSHAALNAVERSSESVVMSEIRVLETQKRRNGAVSRIVAEQNMSIGGEQIFSGTGAWTVQPPALFQRLRRMSPRGSAAVVAQEIRASVPRRRNNRNVVITVPVCSENSAEFVSELIVDDTHPYFFDHACDHIPGMLLLEGCAQLALAAAGADSVISAYTVNFERFVELHHPVTLTASVDEAAVRISISQEGAVSGTTTMNVVRPN